MASPVPVNAPSVPLAPVVGSGASASPDSVTAAGLAQSHSVTSASTVNNMADLKKKAPKVYQQMMEGIAMNICNEMKDHQDRLKQMMDEANRGG